MTPERVCQAGRRARADASRTPTAASCQFFGDLHPSFAGNVVKAMGGAKQGYPVVTRMLAKLPAPRRSPARDPGRGQRRTGAPRCVRVDRLTPTIVEVVVEAPAAARNFQPGQFYRLQNYEARSQEGRRHAAHHGRPGADRRLGRQGEGPGVADRARDGRLVRPLRAAQARRAGDPDGPDRHADRDRAGRDRGAGRRRPRQRRAVLDRPGVPQGRQQVLYFAGYKKMQRPLQGRGDRGAPPTSSSGAATRRRASRRAGRRTRPSSATSSRRCAIRARASSASSRSRSTTPTASIAIGSDGMMNAVRLARHARAEAVPEARSPRDRHRSTRRCNA